MTHGLIFMTALLPTVGHEHIIDFAANFVDQVHVVISTRSYEPTTFYQRRAAFLESMPSNVNYYWHDDDRAPQNPVNDNDVEFWRYWSGVVEKLVNEKIDYVFASEPYGQAVADSLEADFIPVDIAREVQAVKGSTVRQKLFTLQDNIALGFKQFLELNVVLFGQESCGKTTMARKLAKHFNGTFVPEWARPYLETVGATVTEHKMRMIVNGQHASERAVSSIDTLIKFKDTDLLSTLGFYRLYGISEPAQLQWMIDDYPNDLYIVMNDNIPFESDQLRYGVDKRETDRKYWIDILEEQDREYYVVQNTDPQLQFDEIVDYLLNYKLSSGITYKQLMTFQRD